MDERHADLPPAEPDLRSLDPNQLKVLRVRGIIASVALLGIAAGASLAVRDTPVPGWGPIAIGVVLALLLIFVVPQRRYRAWAYHESEDELLIRSGLLFQVRTVVPFGRVQHIDLSQGPVERAYRVATLTLHTAGTAGASVDLPGLALPQAERMRDHIRAQIRQDLS